MCDKYIMLYGKAIANCQIFAIHNCLFFNAHVQLWLKRIPNLVFKFVLKLLQKSPFWYSNTMQLN